MCVTALAAAVGGQVIGAAFNAYGANKAAKAQKKAVGQANALLGTSYNSAINTLNPYAQQGQDFQNRYMSEPVQNWLTSKFNPQDAENLPGYQFQLKQGLQATDSAASARGHGGASGFRDKARIGYAEGLAASNWQNYFNQDMQNRNQVAGLYTQGIERGQQAAGNIANLQTGLGTAQANNLVGAGNAKAAAINSGAQGFGQAASNIGNAGMQYYSWEQLQKNKLLPEEQPQSPYYTMPGTINQGIFSNPYGQ